MRQFLIGILLLIPLIGFAQKEGDIWYVDKGVLMDFTNDPISITAPAIIGATQGTTTLSDREGNLLLYSNGWQLRDSTFGLVSGWAEPNIYAGTDNIVQGCLLLTINDSLVYFITRQDGVNQFWGVADRLFKIGLNGANGLPFILPGDTIIGDSLNEQLAAVRHADGKSWWVISHYTASNVFVKFLISEDGTIARSEQAVGSTLPVADIRWMSPLVFSPQGNRFAFGVDTTRLEIFNFDRCTGDISLFNFVEKYFVPLVPLWGLSFSPNSKMLYASDGYYGPLGDSLGTPSNVYQYNLDSANLLSSQKIVYSTPPPCEPWWQGGVCRRSLGGHKLGPDGRIYIRQASPDINFTIWDSLIVIQNPDLSGLDCDVRVNEVAVPPGTGYRSTFFPNIPNYRLGPLVAQVAEAGPNRLLCPGDSVKIGLPDTSANLIFQWTPTTGLSDPSAAQPMASPSVSTTYYLIVEDSSVSAACNSTLDSVRVTVINPESYGPPSANAGMDTLICASALVTLGVADTSGGSWTYEWTPAAGLDNPQSPQPIATTAITQNYLLTVSRPEVAGTCMTVQDSVSVAVYDPSVLPQEAAGDDAVICVEDSIAIGKPAQSGFEYTWSPTTNLSDPQSSNPNAWPDASLNYVLQVRDPIVSGPCGEIRDTLRITVEQPLSHAAPSDITFCPGECFTIGVAPQPNLIYTWSSSSGGSSTVNGLDNPQSSLTRARPGSTTLYTLTIIDPNRQSANCREISFPVTATADNCNFQTFLWPNGDGIAETLDFGEYDAVLALDVFDVQGRLVFRSADYRNDPIAIGWDGGGISPGVYVYRLTIQGPCGFSRTGKFVRF
jgi:hypothetical protein